MKKFLFVSVMLLTIAATKAQTVTPEFESAMKEFIEVSDVKSLLNQLPATLTAMMPDELKNKEEFNKMYEDFIADMNEAMPEAMTNVYSRHFSVEEIKELTAYNKTPLGKKKTQTTVPIMKKSAELLKNYLLDEDKTELQAVDPEYAEAVVEMLKSSGLGEQMEENMSQVGGARQKTLDAMYKISPYVYSEFFTLDEIKQLSEWNKTDLGNKFVGLQTSLHKELIGEMQPAIMKFSQNMMKLFKF